MSMDSGKRPPGSQRKLTIFIDGAPVQAPKQTMTGLELRQLTDPEIGGDRDLWQDVKGELDNLVEDEEPIRLKSKMVFFTVPKVINPGIR